MKRVILIHKPTGVQLYEGTGFIETIEKGSPDYFSKIQKVHDHHLRSLDSLVSILTSIGVSPEVYRRDDALPVLEDADLIVSLGGDGTFITASHSLQNTPILGINSVPFSSIGHYCSLAIHGTESFPYIQSTLERIVSGKEEPKKMTRLQLFVSGKPLPIPVINDVLIAEKSPAATSRYVLYYKGKYEMQKSSGIWLATATGSTAAFRSAGGTPFGDDCQAEGRRFGFIVREQYNFGRESIRAGTVEKPEDFHLVSGMPVGRLFLDGSHSEFELTPGQELRIDFYEHPLRVFRATLP